MRDVRCPVCGYLSRRVNLNVVLAYGDYAFECLGAVRHVFWVRWPDAD